MSGGEVIQSKIYNYCEVEHNLNNDARISESDKIIYFGKNNDFPQVLASAVKDSHTARACLETKSQFIEGGGFSNEDIGNVVINDKGHTMNDLHHSNSIDLSYFDGFSNFQKWKPNQGGSVSDIYFKPFELFRMGLPDKKTTEIKKIAFNRKFGDPSDYKPEETVFYDVFTSNRDNIVKMLIEGRGTFKGTVSYYCRNTPNSRYYSDPHYYSGIEWLFVDAKIGEFHERNIDNNFLLSAIFKMVGDPDKQIVEEYTDDNGDTKTRVIGTVGESFDEMMRQRFSGSKSGGAAIALWSKMKEQFPEIEAFPANTHHELFLALQDMTSRNITIATGVPAILANIPFGASLNGEGDNIRQSIKMMQSRVVSYHRLLETYYNKIKEVYDPLKKAVGDDLIKITPYSPLPEEDMMPEMVWDALSDQEKRRWISDNTNIEIEIDGDTEDIIDQPE